MKSLKIFSSLFVVFCLGMLTGSKIEETSYRILAEQAKMEQKHSADLQEYRASRDLDAPMAAARAAKTYCKRMP